MDAALDMGWKLLDVVDSADAVMDVPASDG